MIKNQGLAKLTVQRTTAQERIILHLLQTSWSVKALLVTRRSVARSRLPFGFSFRAFEDDDIAWHGSEKVRK